METVLYKAESRGHANHGWLDSHHTFSFARYYNPDRMQFGAMRVFNDDVVQPGRGFGTHPHANMEIVSIPLQGALKHKDSTGRQKTIETGEVQIMSAGTGIQHSEANASTTGEVNFLQIWILPDKQNIEPRYAQKEFKLHEQPNKLLNVVAPDNPEALWINQKAWFYLGEYDKEHQVGYSLNDAANGIFIFVIEGELEVEDNFLKKRDAIGITGQEEILLKPTENSKILLIETTMVP